MRESLQCSSFDVSVDDRVFWLLCAVSLALWDGRGRLAARVRMGHALSTIFDCDVVLASHACGGLSAWVRVAWCVV